MRLVRNTRQDGTKGTDRPTEIRHPRDCFIDGCSAPTVGRRMCRKHYSRWYKHGDPLYEKSRHPVPAVCEATDADGDCQSPGFVKRLCVKHYFQMRRHNNVKLREWNPDPSDGFWEQVDRLRAQRFPT